MSSGYVSMAAVVPANDPASNRGNGGRALKGDTEQRSQTATPNQKNNPLPSFTCPFSSASHKQRLCLQSWSQRSSVLIGWNRRCHFHRNGTFVFLFAAHYLFEMFANASRQKKVWICSGTFANVCDLERTSGGGKQTQKEETAGLTSPGSRSILPEAPCTARGRRTGWRHRG